MFIAVCNYLYGINVFLFAVDFSSRLMGATISYRSLEGTNNNNFYKTFFLLLLFPLFLTPFPYKDKTFNLEVYLMFKPNYL